MIRRINHLPTVVVSLLVIALLGVSCDKNRPSYTPDTLTVKVKPVLEGVTISLTNRKTGETSQKQTTEEGTALFEITKGQYNILAEQKDKNGVLLYFGRADNVTFASSTEKITLPIAPIDLQSKPSFVLDELYFNGSMGLRKWKAIFNDQYFTICNNSDHPLYADGLSVGMTADYNHVPWDTDMPQYLPDYVAVTQVYTIPGSGTDVLVKPGESLVIARSAINHVKDPKQDIYTPDLSGADFEVYVPHQYSVTVDNPEVPNLIVHHSHFQAFNWLFDGGNPLLIFKVDDVDKLLKENLVRCINPACQSNCPPHVKYMACIKIPTSSIIDGVETGCKNYLAKKVLPKAVDRGAFLIPGTGTQFMGSSHQGFFLKRKETTNAEGRKVKQDTNDSTGDFEMILNGQKSYPAKKKKQ